MALSKIKRGSVFHKTVEIIEKSIHNNDNIKIKSPEYIIDIISGQLREHDIVLYIDENHFKIKIAIECRDRKRKIDSPQLEAFKKKCEETGIDKGVIVSKMGFYKPEIKKAKHYNISCLTLQQIQSISWLKTEVFIKESNKFINVFVGIIHIGKKLKDYSQYEIKNLDGITITKDILKNNAEKIFNNQKLENEQVGLNKVRINVKGNEFYLQNKTDTQRKYKIESFNFDITYIKEITEIPLAKFQYFDSTNNEIRYDVAMAKTKISEKDITFSLISDKDKTKLTIHSE